MKVINFEQKIADTRSRVVKFILYKMGELNLSIRDVALATDYSTSVISSILNERMKVPANKAGVFAKVLDTSETHFVRLLLSEQLPDCWKQIEKALEFAATDSERKILEIIRETADGYEIFPANDEQIREFKDLVKKWAKQQHEKEEYFIEQREIRAQKSRNKNNGMTKKVLKKKEMMALESQQKKSLPVQKKK